MENQSERGPQKWRVVFDGAHSGARNMATDEALARVHLDDARALPTLRFYEWEPSCLSLGRVQKLDGPLQVLEGRRSGLDWVRRPSGGRAVWHEAEVTYSLALALEHLPESARSIVGAYEWLSRPLLRGLQTLGIHAEIAASQAHDKHERNCFLSSSQADAVVAGRKLIGGAQCRFEDDERAAVLQHGSILIDLDARSWARALGQDEHGSQLGRMQERMLSLRELGVAGPLAEVRARVQEAIARALSQSHGIEVTSLGARELELRDELERTKYLSESWNARGRLAQPIRE